MSIEWTGDPEVALQKMAEVFRFGTHSRGLSWNEGGLPRSLHFDMQEKDGSVRRRIGMMATVAFGQPTILVRYLEGEAESVNRAFSNWESRIRAGDVELEPRESEGFDT